MTFKNPEFLFMFLLWIPAVWVYILRERKSGAAVRFSDLGVIKKLKPSFATRARHVIPVLRFLGSGLLIVALARPQEGRTDEEVSTEGIDIVLVLDISESMRALDFKPENRLEVAKQTMVDFVKKRSHDRIGLVVFGSRAYTKCPLTLDYDVLQQFIGDITFTEYSSRTAIGTAIATAANRLKDSAAKSKVVILLTDGANNAGDIPPQTAGKAASKLGIKIYTIGVGKKGQVPIPVQMKNPFTGQVVNQVQMMESDLDEGLLEQIAVDTKGLFFRADNPEKLKEIYDEIDQLEKTEIKTTVHTSYEEKFYPWLWAGFIVLMLELILQHTRFRRIP